MSVLDFFSAEAGQRRRRALDEFGRDVGRYVPPELRPVVGLLAQSTPTAANERAAMASRRMVSPNRTPMQRVGDFGEMASEVAGVVAPAAVASRAAMPAAQAIQEGLLGLSVPARAAGQAVVDRANQRGPVPTMYSNVPVRANDKPAGIKAFHGSPHDFDRFSMDAIGTGEGAQAYGHGLYLAESEPIARHYRDKLSGLRLAAANRKLDANDGDINAAISSTKREIERLEGLPDDAGSKKYAFIRLNEEALEDLQRMSAGEEVGVGRMYEVNVNAPEGDFIDYDARLDEQSDLVKSVLGSGEEAAGARLKRAYDNEMFGGDMLGQDRATPAELSRGLLDKGIKGIRYLDASSRGMGYKINLSRKGEPYETEPIEVGSRRQAEALAKEYQEKGFGTNIEAIGKRNLVVFDDSIVSIVRKYGIAGAAAMLGLSQAEVAQAMQAQQPQQSQGLLDGPQ